jgi:hypothetical protein
MAARGKNEGLKQKHRSSVMDDDEFKIAKTLVENAFDRFGQETALY